MGILHGKDLRHLGHNDDNQIDTGRQAQLLDVLMPHHNADGVDESRIHHFVKAVGLPLPKYVVLDDALHPVVEQAVRHAGVNTQIPKGTSVYHPELDVAIVYRGRESPEMVEHILLHEIAHGRKTKKPRSAKFIEVMRGAEPRVFSGFVDEYGGSFNEESYATLISGAFRSVVGGVRGTNTDKIDTYPQKYHGNVRRYMLGAIAMETMCRFNPDIVAAMLFSRTNHTTMRNVKDNINAIDQGLFERLHALNGHDDESCWQGMTEVSAATKIGWQSAFKIAADEPGPLDTYISDKLDVYEQQTGYSFQRVR